MFLILEIRNVDVQNHKWLKIIDIEYLNVDVSKYIYFKDALLFDVSKQKLLQTVIIPEKGNKSINLRPNF